MKTIVFFFALVLSYNVAHSQSNTNSLIASCCEEGRGCKGSAFCSACKNCTGCKHCAKNGGSCGVCSDGSSKSYSTSRRGKKSSSPNKSTYQKKYVVGEKLVTTSTTLNLREGPNVSYKIVEKLRKDTTLKLLEISGSWLKVKVEKTKIIGFVYAKYVTISK